MKSSKINKNLKRNNYLARLWSRGWPWLVLVLPLILFFWQSIRLGRVLVPADLLASKFPWKPYFPSDFQIHNFFASDIIDSQYPARAVARHIIKSGQLPLWDPYTSGGKPLGTMPIYPLTLPLNILLWLVPLDIGFTWSTAIRLFISSITMFAFLRELRLDKMSAVLGGIIFAFNGFIIVWLNATAGTTLSLTPLVFWAGERAIKKASGGNLCLLALSVGLVVSGAFLAIVLYVLYVLSAYLAFRAIQLARQQNDKGRILRKLILAGIAIALGLALMAPQLWSFGDHLSLTSYDDARSSSQRGLVSEPLYNAIRYLIPDYYGKPATHDWFDSYPERTGYVGILPLILAGLSLFLARRKGITWFFAGVGFMAIGTVYGLPVNQLMGRLPGLMMAPSTRLKSIFALSVAVLAALGLNALRESPPKNRWRVLAAALIMIACMAGVIVLVENHWLSTASSHVFDRTLIKLLQKDALAHHQFDNLLLWSLWVLSSLLLLLLWARRLLPPRLLRIGALVLVCADLVGWGMTYNYPVPRSQVFPQTPGITFLQNRPGFFRMTGTDGTFYPNMPSVYRLQDIGGHDPLSPDRH
ncbi:MAG: hypothetical protein B6I34_07020, partial [Anaerolineaceae bacterium 4572_32.1]